MQVLLNVLADEIHRAHQRCLIDGSCDPHREVRHLPSGSDMDTSFSSTLLYK